LFLNGEKVPEIAIEPVGLFHRDDAARPRPGASQRWRIVASAREFPIRDAQATVSAAPNPVVERPIGPESAECLDGVLFWTAADLERKLVDFLQYYNEHRTRAGRAGCPPPPHADGRVTPSIPNAFTPATYEFATHTCGLPLFRDF
jgi:hypothetical protein